MGAGEGEAEVMPDMQTQVRRKGEVKYRERFYKPELKIVGKPLPVENECFFCEQLSSRNVCWWCDLCDFEVTVHGWCGHYRKRYGF